MSKQSGNDFIMNVKESLILTAVNSRRLRIALVNQRYGLEVNGGSEYYTRLIAERLIEYFDLEVLTTRAIDHVTWANHYPEGPQIVGGIPVRRFSVKKPRNFSVFGPLNQVVLASPNKSEQLQERWLDEQGPFSTDLVEYIRRHADEYDVFIFVTYLYYSTVRGMPLVSNKAILIPTAHDEEYIYLQIYRRIFQCPQAIIYLTNEEKAFVEGMFHTEVLPNAVIGVGVTVPDMVDGDSFRKKYNIDGDYIIYVGRIEEGKGCHWLFRYFEEYKRRTNRSVKLVLMGKAVMDVPRNRDILPLGFVSEEDKYNGIKAAKALVLPSFYESLSIAVLEAMTLSVPVIVNGTCEVLKGHCLKSNGGLYYENYFEFEGVLNYLLDHPGEYAKMQRNAKEYVETNFKWDYIVKRLNEMVLLVAKTNFEGNPQDSI